jgi:DNA-binding transcriptional LysR family regulator
MERGVARGELDFAVAPGPAQDDEIASHKICEVECTWMASPSRIAPGSVLTPKQLEAQPVITMTEGSGMTVTINQWALEQDIRLQRTLSSNSLMAIIGLTTADIGISYLPVAFMQPWIAQDRLVAFRSKPPPPDLTYFFLHRSDDKRDLIPAMRQLVASAADYGIDSEPRNAPKQIKGRKTTTRTIK